MTDGSAPLNPKAERAADKARAKALRPWFKKKRFIIPAVLVALIVVISISNAGNKSTDQASTVASTTTAPAASDVPAAAPATPAAPAAPAVPAEFKSALNKAQTYSDTMQMSKAGLYDQLTSQAGEQFTAEAGQYAVDNVKADWNANALGKAKTYQKTMSMSPAAIRDQLTSQAGEKFTAGEADYAIQHLND
jgi:hypothetical protein